MVDGREMLRLVNPQGQVFVVSSQMAEKVAERVADSLFPPTLPLHRLKEQKVVPTETSALKADPFFSEPATVVRIVSERATLRSATGQIRLSVPLSDLKRWRADGHQSATNLTRLVNGPLGGAIATVAQKLLVGGVALKTRA